VASQESSLAVTHLELHLLKFSKNKLNERQEPALKCQPLQGIMKKIASQLYIICIVSISLLAGCTYGPVQERSVITNGWFSTDSGTLYVAINKSSYREATGLSTFPNGGRSLILSQELRVFQLDVTKGIIALVQTYSAPDSVWVAFTPRIWSVAQEGVYILFTGCPRGGECYAPQNKRQFYLLDLQKNIRKIPSIPEPPRNKKPNSMTVSIYSDRIEIWSRDHKKMIHQFMLDSQKGNLSTPVI
jgi:hypothetical protein